MVFLFEGNFVIIILQKIVSGVLMHSNFTRRISFVLMFTLNYSPTIHTLFCFSFEVLKVFIIFTLVIRLYYFYMFFFLQ